jgi:hypothetical protein
MLTVDEWRPFLQSWSTEWLSAEAHFPESASRRGWLGFEPATPMCAGSTRDEISSGQPVMEAVLR